MASTFTLKSRTYEGRYMMLTLNQTKDIANNRSKILWELESTGGSGNFSIAPTDVKINGVNVYSCDLTRYTEDEFPARAGSVSGSLYVSHESSGEKTISVSMDTNVYDWTPIHYSGSWTLDTIYRQADIVTAPNFTDNSNPTITYSNKAGKYVTSLEACISLTGSDADIAYRSIRKTGSSYTFNLTDAERNVLRNGTSGTSRTVKFIIKTVIGGNTFKSIVSKTFTVQETATTKPSVSIATDIVNGSLPSDFSSMYIQGKSKVKVTANASGKFGASISSYSITVNGVKYTGQTITSGYISTAGQVTVSCTVKDSRGFTNTVSKTISVTGYAKPTIKPVTGEASVQCYRCDDSVEKTSSGESLYLKALMSYTSLSGKNSCTMYVRTKESTVSTWGAWTALATTDNAFDGKLTGTFDKSKSYNVQVYAKDTIGDSSSVVKFSIPTEYVTFHLPEGGKRFALGKYSEKDGFECGMAADFTGGMEINGAKTPNLIINNNAPTVSVESGSWTNVAEITIPYDGVWLVNATAAFAYVNTTGRRRSRLSKKNGTEYSVCGYTSIDYRSPMSGVDTTCRSLVLDNLSAGTYCIQVEQNSGSAVDVIPSIYACCLGK